MIKEGLIKEKLTIIITLLVEFNNLHQLVSQIVSFSEEYIVDIILIYNANMNNLNKLMDYFRKVENVEYFQSLDKIFFIKRYKKYFKKVI